MYFIYKNLDNSDIVFFKILAAISTIVFASVALIISSA